MKHVFRTLCALALIAPLASSQITDGYYSDGAGYACKVEVSDVDPNVPGVDVTITDAGGTRTTTGVEGTSKDGKPTASSFPEGTTPRGSTTTRGSHGNVQKKTGPTSWSSLHKVKKPRGKRGSYRDQPKPGPEGVGSLPGGTQPQGL